MTTDDSEMSKSRHQSRLRLAIELLKICFQGFLAGFVITPFVTGKLQPNLFIGGFLMSLLLVIFAWIIEGRRIREESQWSR